MTRIFTTLIALAAAAAAATAQPAGAYVGRLTRDNVYLRSGGSPNYYPVMKLSAPATVEVVGVEGEWLKITPPPGAFSLVAKRYVDVAGEIGTITGDRVTVRAGSLEQPSMMTTVQGYLSSGGTVRILGQTEEYYKIAPPAGTVLYVYAPYVERVAAVEAAPPAGGAAAAQPSEPAATQPAATQPAATEPAATQPVEPVEPTAEQRHLAAIKAFRELEEALFDEYAKPAEQRDLEGFLASYLAFDVPADSPLAEQKAFRVRWLELAIQRRQGAREVEALSESALRQQRLLIAGLQDATGGPRRMEDLVSFSGGLTASCVYQGLGGMPKRWVLADAKDPAQLMYVEGESAAAAALNNAIGWNVKLTGLLIYDRKIQAQVLHVRDVERLSPAPAVRTAAPKAPPAAPLENAPFPQPWTRPVKPAQAEPSSADTIVPAPADHLLVVPATQPAPAVVDPREYQ
ncbi:MAG: hypothetical protein GX591_04345 [Planctomycetes bacterium]|nr:hypothetical protein [Planctomycetota bacterium]